MTPHDNFLNPHRGWYRSRRLPHWDEPYVTQNITFRLYDSLPVQVVTDLRHTLNRNPKLTMKQRYQIEKYLDEGYGACYLKHPDIANVVANTFRFYDKKRYELVAWVVMPNHIHVLIHMGHGHPLPSIIQDWKSYSAHQANRILQRTGKFWQTGYFDRFIRDDTHFANAID